MKRETFRRLSESVARLRKTRCKLAGVEVPESIPFLESELGKVTDPQTRYALYQMIRDEFSIAGLSELEIESLRKCAFEFAAEPLPWISLANRIAVDADGRKEAKALVDQAYEKAVQTNRFVRHVLISRARIAVAEGDAHSLNSCLRKLIDDAPNSRTEDSRFETDFLDSTCAELADQELVRKYYEISGSTVGLGESSNPNDEAN